MRLLLDVSGVAHAAERANNLKDSRGRSTSAIYGVLRTLEALSAHFGPDEIIVCFDAKSEARKELFPGYKSKRDDTDPVRIEVHRQLKDLRKLLEVMPVQVMYEPGVEADDIIALLSGFLKHERVVIVSRDSDLHQLIRTEPVIHTISNFDGSSVTPRYQNPVHAIIHKCLEGDTSDQIPGVAGIGKVKAYELIRDHKTAKRIFTRAKSEGKLGRMSFKEAMSVFKRNIKLIRLNGDLLTIEQKKSILDSYREGRKSRIFYKHTFEMALMELEFVSIERRLAEYMASFETVVTMKAQKEYDQTRATDGYDKDDLPEMELTYDDGPNRPSLEEVPKPPPRRRRRKRKKPLTPPVEDFDVSGNEETSEPWKLKERTLTVRVAPQSEEQTNRTELEDLLEPIMSTGSWLQGVGNKDLLWIANIVRSAKDVTWIPDRRTKHFLVCFIEDHQLGE